MSETGKCIRKIEGHQFGHITALAISQDGSTLVSGATDKDIRICRTEKNRIDSTFDKVFFGSLKDLFNFPKLSEYKKALYNKDKKLESEL